MRFFEPIPISDQMDPQTMLRMHRLNSLGSLYYFLKIALKRDKLTRTFHEPFCRSLECDTLHKLIEMPRDHFKALDIDTLIPTPLGFRKMGELKVGDHVFGIDGNPVKITRVTPHFQSENSYEVRFSTGDAIVADEGHEWTTQVTRVRKNNRKARLDPSLSNKISTTSEIKADLVYTIRDGYKEYNHRVWVASSIKMEGTPLVIHPYALGVWLGDGDSAGARFTAETSDIPDMCSSFGEITRKNETSMRYAFCNDFTKRLRQIDVLNNKHIPIDYLFATATSRLQLLRGLMDTDGSVSKEGQCSFTGMSRLLVEQTRILVASLGYKPSEIGSYDSSLDGKSCGKFFVFTFYASKEKAPFLLARKVKRCRSIRPQFRQIVDVVRTSPRIVCCITIDRVDGLFLVGEGFIPTHNSTIAGEGMPMWRVLPLANQDIDLFLKLGFDDEFVRHMILMHDCTKRNLLVSSNITNSSKLGSKIRRHYESNSIYRTLFPETLPSPSERWTDFSLQVRQPLDAAPHGEGTFDFIGVGGASQSRHYNGLIIEDDLVGPKEAESPSVIEKTIDYHVLVAALFEHGDPNHIGDRLVIGNRWGYRDLNSYIREHEQICKDDPKGFQIESHSALGGCCDKHPSDTPIFPEHFSIEKLMKLKHDLGSYRFSCQYINNPAAPEDAEFAEADINWYDFYKVGDNDDGSLMIRHEVKNGIIRPDLHYRKLDVVIACDPTHTSTGRCRHAIVVLGMSPENNYYLLESWAEASSHETFFNKIYDIAKRWRCHSVGFETCAGQSLALPHFKYLNTVKDWPLRITELKGEVEGPDGEITTKKEWRIRNTLAPIIEFGRFFMRRKQLDVLNELTTFPRGKYCDQIDAMAYIPQILRNPTSKVADAKFLRMNQLQQKQIALPYSTMIHQGGPGSHRSAQLRSMFSGRVIH